MFNRFLIFIVFFCVSICSAQQYSVSLGSDMKILIFGTDNEFTSHSAAFNYATKFVYIDERNNYLAIGYTYANLNASYDAWYITGGFKRKLYKNLFYIPHLELGRIARNFAGTVNDVKPLYIQTNLSLRYDVTAALILDLTFNLQLARDLQNRTFRYGAVFSIITPVF